MTNNNWTNITIPPDSPLIKIINENKGLAAHKAIAKNLKVQPKTKEEEYQEFFEKIVDDANKLKPGSEELIEQLRPLIIRQIFKGTQLNHDYYIHLEEVLRVDKE